MAVKKRIDFYIDKDKEETCTACNAKIKKGDEFGVIEGLNYVVCLACATNPDGIKLSTK